MKIGIPAFKQHFRGMIRGLDARRYRVSAYAETSAESRLDAFSRFGMFPEKLTGVLASLSGEGRVIGDIRSVSSAEPRVRYEG